MGDVGLSATDSGGKLAFYGQDPIIPSAFRFGAMAAIGLAAKAVAVAALWRARTGEGRTSMWMCARPCAASAASSNGDGKPTMDGPPRQQDGTNPFTQLPLFHETSDGRNIVALNTYPKLLAGALGLLRCCNSHASVRNAILIVCGNVANGRCSLPSPL